MRIATETEYVMSLIDGLTRSLCTAADMTAYVFLKTKLSFRKHFLAKTKQLCEGLKNSHSTLNT